MNKIVVMLITFLLPALAFAAEGDGVGVTNSAYYAITAGFGISLAAFGGAWGQARIGAATMEGIARNPQARQDMFVPMILSLALIESLVIYVLVIAFQLVGKI